VLPGPPLCDQCRAKRLIPRFGGAELQVQVHKHLGYNLLPDRLPGRFAEELAEYSGRSAHDKRSRVVDLDKPGTGIAKTSRYEALIKASFYFD